MKIDSSLVRHLLADQFPQWASLPVRPVEIDGHDNRTFRLGEEMGVRMPSAARYAAHVSVEHQWLPVLGVGLPLPIPIPLEKGKPGPGYPWPWTVSTWIPGDNASIGSIADPEQFARDLAGFLTALQAIDATTASKPGEHNFFRGGALSVYDSEARECLDLLRDGVDTAAASSVWDSALESRWENEPVWIHGDVAEGNLLVQDGRLCAVIDFGQLAAGDPACDLTIAWTLFSGPSREAFRSNLDMDEATWARARGWGLWKAMLELRAHRGNNPPRAARAERVITDILADG